ncbi:MAG TPA: hypothetical protein VGP82_22480 [Ktedonobacterales bacterium]|jgi:hypothetical protein|nr:hypothetical protein [Ktedonobacterales bacterium]
MSDAEIRRVTAVAGFAAFVLYVASAILILDVPGIDAGAQSVTAYTASHGTSFILELTLRTG